MTREYVTIPKEAWDFLCGQGELDGVSFGEPHPTRSGAFWWRSYIAALAPAPAPDDVALVDELETAAVLGDDRMTPRTALLARLRQRDDVIEECERIVTGLAAAIRALKGK